MLGLGVALSRESGRKAPGAGAGIGAPTTVRPRRSTQVQHGGVGLILTPSWVQSVKIQEGDLGEDVFSFSSGERGFRDSRCGH